MERSFIALFVREGIVLVLEDGGKGYKIPGGRIGENDIAHFSA